MRAEVSGSGRGLRSFRVRGAAVLLGCVSTAAVCGKWLPGLAQARPKIKEIELAPSPAPTIGVSGGGACGEALSTGYGRFEAQRSSWVAASSEGRALREFGKAAVAAEKAALASFDGALADQGAQGSCGPQRKALEAAVRKDVWTIFLTQRLIAERQASDRLTRQLLAKMTKRGSALRVQEKIDLLRQEVAAYKASVQRLLPEWASDGGDPEEGNAERRLGEVQFTIEDTSAGLVLQNRWKQSQMQKLASKRAHGVSVSLDPALRVLVRPEGLGNLQVFSVGPAGPPSSPVTVNFGIMNDGSIADVYREHPEPPLLAVQPAVKVNVNMR